MATVTNDESLFSECPLTSSRNPASFFFPTTAYSKVNYSVDSLNFEYLFNLQSDLCEVENPVELGGMVLEISAWKSVYRIIAFTVHLEQSCF